MPLATTVAGAAALGAYLDAKYHIRKDLRSLYRLKSSEWDFAKALRKNRQSIWYLFEDQVARLPADEACLWSRETGNLTWREVHSLACRYAQFMIQNGVRPGDLVGFYLQNSAHFMIAFLATWAIGTAPAMFNYNVGGEGFLHCLKTAGSKLVLVDEDETVRSRFEEVRGTVEGELGAKGVVLDRRQRDEIARIPDTRPGDEWRDGVKGEDPMMLLFTSGTTGFPKACPYHIMRAHQSAGNRCRGIGLEPGPNGDRWYVPMPMYHGTGANSGCMGMMCGVTVCIGKRFSTSTFWDDIRASEATAFVYVGETARYLLAAPESPRDRDHNVRMMFGNGMRPDVWRRFQKRFGVDMVSEFFNSTEGVFTLINVSRGEFFATAVGHHGLLLRALLYGTYIPVAVDPATNEIIRDPETGFAYRQPYAAGGEMIVAVPSVEESGFIGYTKNEAATNKRFARDVFKKGDLYFRSGDALRRDEEGRWYFLDRLGDTFRWKSENVSTAEVAEVMGQFPDVIEANVYGVLVPGHDGRAGCAALYVQPEKKDSFDYAGLLRFMQERLPRYAVPVFLRVGGDVSPMHNQKQNKVPLREEGVDLDKIRNGSSAQDKVLWAPMGAETYTEFGDKEARMISGGQAKL